MFELKALKTVVAAGALALMASGAQATTVTVDSVGDTFDVDYSYESLVATLTWTVTGIVGNTWSFSVLIDNLSSDDPNANRITSFGFSTDPNASNLVVPGAWGGTTSGPFGAGYQNFGIEACVFAGNNCQGGGNNGVAGGDSDTVAFSFVYGVGPLTFTDFATRWQSISVTDPSNPSGPDATSIVIGPSVVPVPAAGFLLIGALGGLAALRRRRKA
jgi:hypothetical protein